jgi:hypothetical protein
MAGCARPVAESTHELPKVENFALDRGGPSHGSRDRKGVVVRAAATLRHNDRRPRLARERPLLCYPIYWTAVERLCKPFRCRRK